MKTPLLLLVFTGFLTNGAFAQAELNLAKTAQASASESLDAFTPTKAIDGAENTRWSGIPGHNSGVWYELRWPTKQSIGEVVVKQYDRFTMEWDLETWDDARSIWITRQHLGSYGERLTKNVLMRLPRINTTRIRISNITNGPSFNEVEVFADPNQHPETIAMASDLRGNFIGIVTDSLGASPVADELVSLSGQSAKGDWVEKVATDRYGMFAAPMPLGLKGMIWAKAMHSGSADFDVAEFQYRLAPISTDSARTELDGVWKFQPNPPDGFWERKFDDHAWANIGVPAHWEMQGFRTDVGGYRKVFDLPSGSGRIKLRFDGVYSGAEVWVNGSRLAYHEGGFTPFEVDITNVAVPGKNLVALKVSEHTNVSDNLDHMSLYADFPLGGIIRKAFVFRVPDVHIASLEVSCRNVAANSTLSGTATIVNESKSKVRLGDFLATASYKEDSFSSPKIKLTSIGPWEAKRIQFTIPIAKPAKWTAETPSLYELTCTFVAANEKVELKQTIGLRETKVVGSQILINDSPVKFRGTCHHDSDPLLGRAASVTLTQTDMDLIKEANLNSVRTSHYPPVPELIDIADKIGLYVEDEASFCWVGAANDLRNTPRIIQLTAEMLARDRNHPSVFMWSLCNESEFGYGFERSHEWVRKVDPSRPTSAATSRDLEIATLHNPIAISRIQQTENIGKPLLFDESWCIFQGIFNDVAEMWVDPGIRDYYAEPLPEIYKTFMNSKTTQGSMIWAWSDDIFCVPGRGLEYGRGTTQSHFIDDQYRVPGRGLVGDAPWGVVDGWRRKKPEFWITKKLQSPIKLSEAPLPLPPPGQHLKVKIENQYDFINLSDLIVLADVGDGQWSNTVDVPPRSTRDIDITSSKNLQSGTSLSLTFETREGKIVDEFRIPIGVAKSQPIVEKTTKNKPLEIHEEHWLAGNTVRVTGERFEIMFDQDGGYLKRCVVDNQPLLLEFPALHILRTDSPLEPIPVATRWACTQFSLKKEGENVRVKIEGKYPQFVGGYDLLISPDGQIQAHYSFEYQGQDMLTREVGWRLAIPRDCDTLEWDRNAEWNVYPADHIGRPHGTAQAFPGLNKNVGEGSWSNDESPMGSNDFRSTKRHINWAELKYANGVGVHADSNGKTSARAIVQPDRTCLHINDWYGGTNVGWWEWITNYGQGRSIKRGEKLESSLTIRLRQTVQLQQR